MSGRHHEVSPGGVLEHHVRLTSRVIRTHAFQRRSIDREDHHVRTCDHTIREIRRRPSKRIQVTVVVGAHEHVGQAHRLNLGTWHGLRLGPW